MSRFPCLATFSPWLLQAAVVTASLCAGGAMAAPVSDPAGDFIASYTGPRNAELDVLQADFTYDGTFFHFSSVQAGPISTSSGAVFVWGVNRGAGTPRFAALGLLGVLFDSVVSINPTAGTATVNRLVGGGTTVLTGAALHILGNSLSVDVPAPLLPSQGFALNAYTANLWPRSAATGGTALIADFAPDNTNITVAVVPEPATLALVAAGLVPLVVRRRRGGRGRAGRSAAAA